MVTRTLWAILFSTAVVAPFAPSFSAEQNPPEKKREPTDFAGEVDYSRDIESIFLKRCRSCHGDQAKGGLRLTSREEALLGGDLEPAFVPGKSDESRLIQLVSNDGVDGIVMPPTGKRLSVTEVRLLRAWIDQGAKWPKSESTAPLQAQSHWAFLPIERPALSSLDANDWSHHPIDRFVLARLEESGIAPSPVADRTTLLRRLSLDLTGLPPTPSEVKAFLDDESPHAYERVVDGLLASPQRGERWGAHWLDGARYADSEGHEMDGRRSVWSYRDWVVSAINADQPFDAFGIEQIAGDLLPDATREQHIATGFYRQNMGVGPESIVDRVNTTGSVFLGLTLGCAQCHSHKFEPISQREYYEIYAFLNNSGDPKLELSPPEIIAKRDKVRGDVAALKKRLSEYEAKLRERLPEWTANLTRDTQATLPAAARDALKVTAEERSDTQKNALFDVFKQTDAEHKKRQLAIDELAKTEPHVETTLVLKELDASRQTTMFIRGDFSSPGAPVTPNVPRVLPPLPEASTNNDRRPNRLDLALWLFSPGHPLTARVTVNRIWQRFFGLGLVETEDDFGTQSTPPSHPLLLDWLASEFVAQGWSLKSLQKLIVTSATYQQSSHTRRDLQEIDPLNRLLARGSRLRLEAEVLRDQALEVSGLLDARLGGPPVFPYQVSGVMDGRADKSKWVMSDRADTHRRGLYIHYWRLTPHPLLKMFDKPDAIQSCTRRLRSNTSLQALAILNHPWFVEAAQAFARRIQSVAFSTDDDRIDFAFQVCVARRPTDTEREVLKELLAAQRREFAGKHVRAREVTGVAGDPTDNTSASVELAVWTSVARALLNLDEFITRE